jgi:hypothetical protein
MVKGLFAGLVGLGAASVAVLQVSRSGGAPEGGGPPAIVLADAGGFDAGAAARTATADAGPGATARTATPDAGPHLFVPADAGTLFLGDAPGRLSASDAGQGDGGTADAATPDGGAAGSASAEEVRRLRERVVALEQELARTRAAPQTQQTEQLNELNQQVATLREQLAQEQARRRSEEAAAQQARAEQSQAVSALAAAQQQLAAGDSRVLETLESASDSLPEPAQRAVQSARTAVQSGDLAAARYWLSVAIAQTQQGQIRR